VIEQNGYPRSLPSKSSRSTREVAMHQLRAVQRHCMREVRNANPAFRSLQELKASQPFCHRQISLHDEII
jgi:hypothetical protein